MGRSLDLVGLVGHSTALCNSTAEALSERGNRVLRLDLLADPDGCEEPPRHLVCFPFGSDRSVGATRNWEVELDWWREVFRWAREVEVERIVLRSSATAYGLSFKNYGLMEEDRVSLLDETDLEQRWLRIEETLTSAMGSAGSRVAILRFAPVADPGEGDFLARLFLSTVAVPAAGCDPRLQFVSLRDGVSALLSALDSRHSGVFNIAGKGCIEFRRSLRSAVPMRLPVGHTIQRLARRALWKVGAVREPAESVNQLQHNFTVSSERARTKLGYEPGTSSREALEEMLEKAGREGRRIEAADEFGLDPVYLKFWQWWFDFLTHVYWRTEWEGISNIPASGSALITANHRGFMPFDGVVHRNLILKATGRHVRFLVIPSLLRFPFLADFLAKQGGVIANQLNAARLVSRNELIGIFPEGISGAFRMYKGAYRLGAFGRDAFAKMAIEHSIPIIPAAVIGHVEIFPILAKLHISRVTRRTGWPFLPLTPTFPLLPLPLPSKWHIRYLDPIPTDMYRPEDAGDRKKVRSLSREVRSVLQENIDEMLARRKHVFFGRIFDATRGGGSLGTLPEED